MTNSSSSTSLISQIPPKKKLMIQVAQLLADGSSMPSYDIVATLECNKQSVVRAIRELRALGWVYIIRWVHPGESNALAPVYAWKGLEDRKDRHKPRAKSRSEINRDWNSRNKVYRAAAQRIKKGRVPSIWQGLL